MNLSEIGKILTSGKVVESGSFSPGQIRVTKGLTVKHARNAVKSWGNRQSSPNQCQFPIFELKKDRKIRYLRKKYCQNELPKVYIA